MKTNQAVAATRCSNDFVSIRNDQVVTSSLQVAQVFGREHSKVLRAINDMDCSSQFKEANFGLSFYIRDIDGRGQHKYPLYYLTRDGFTFLAMGFTGKIAAKFKEDYINAFNELEKAISTGKEGEFIVERFQKFCADYSKSAKSVLKDCKDKFGFATHYGCMMPSIPYRTNLTVQENFNFLLPWIHGALVEGLYASHRLLKTEKELSELRRTLSGVMETLYHKHKILPEQW